MAELTCETCKHWHKALTTALTLGQPSHGECREQLHIVAVPDSGPAGLAMRVTPCYPHVPAAMKACSRHAKREVT